MPMIQYYWLSHNSVEPLSTTDIVLSITLAVTVAVTVIVATYLLWRIK